VKGQKVNQGLGPVLFLPNLFLKPVLAGQRYKDRFECTWLFPVGGKS
jgi:hypothetical protein